MRINWCMFDFGPRTHAPLLSWQQRPLSHQWYKMVVTTRSYTGSGTRRTSSKSLGHNICMVFCLLKRGKQKQHNGSPAESSMFIPYPLNSLGNGVCYPSYLDATLNLFASTTRNRAVSEDCPEETRPLTQV